MNGIAENKSSIPSAAGSFFNNGSSKAQSDSESKLKKGVVDMTQGSTMKHIAAFALPMFLGYLFQQFYSMVDTIIVGKFVGVYALAGVGSTGAISFMIIGFCTGICAGFAIPVAQAFGARNTEALRKYFANSIWLSLFFAVFLTVIVCMLTGMILDLMNTQSDIWQYAYDYIFIVFAGIPATLLYNLASSIIRSLGDSKTPVFFLILSSLLNVFLDLYTIIVLGMGVKGAAYATVFSQLVSGVLCVIYMYRRFDIIHLNRSDLVPDMKHIKRLSLIGIPMGLQYTITAVGNVLLQTSVNGLGYAAVAATTAGSKIRLFFCTPYDALGGTMATFAGQNIGAGRPDRVKKGLHEATLFGFIYSVFGIILMLTLGDRLSLLFLDSGETEIISMAKFFLVADAAFGFFLTVVNTYRFAIQGMGYSGLAILAGVMEMIGRSAVAFLAVPVLGFPAACFAAPLAWVLADLFLIPAAYYCLKKLDKSCNYS